MTAYEITFAASAKREFRALSPDVIERIRPKIRELAAGEIRIGDYRVVYAINDTATTVDVTRIAHRREVYE